MLTKKAHPIPNKRGKSKMSPVLTMSEIHKMPDLRRYYKLPN